MGPPSNRAAVLPVAGRFVDDGAAYRIDGVEGMAPFLMSIVSASDHWLFLSSQGGLTAGRAVARDANGPAYVAGGVGVALVALGIALRGRRAPRATSS